MQQSFGTPIYLEKDRINKQRLKKPSRSQLGKFVTKMLEDFDLKPLIKSKRKFKAKTFSDCDCETQNLIKKKSKSQCQ